ncbi:hypothetical protein COW36_08390 [bacterium (Candidatus Blackallbacteria) CG17_big_fil_post_rev_8_21_14_2_50_48_46]|uniref:Haloacid dehalogenase-like hydrolase n=1 Tax=bacterium (Candidatus Blackallbacteria) CG17_big_fil_post_rev_8_21_14_2_50_48_46 TaxID=2014261 RepID=A0A2M7G653_9BACT|nr:MAG: hypothetical protein COW64_24930 [bacterium (Candidatus Blackallbacteria) CG18_big_fil_WC_8_21_14_2_50_49_26]PIW17508.1 MAG: hypothetical protein COW36_08390 [bacterium (Candidatus Blackallbacteria) CG17_big_fil_post_rev_8_21_14_2_50_48_46]PIW48362.1 MAG: hypothetical protein COW20_09745 [bacterium (Candidatus Blackallbacteria) CG13_big_fil_rev_8_21_14_2_50_49_14]
MKHLLALTLTTLLSLPAVAQAAPFELEPGHWNPDLRIRLEKLLTSNSYAGKKVVLDFDNTLVSRDIGEATFAQLERKGKIKRSPALEAISPAFFMGGKNISLDTSIDLAAYYNQLADLDSHPQDVTAAANSYAWMVQAMQGLNPTEVIEATREVYGNNRAESDRKTGQETRVEASPGNTTYRVPFFNPEIVDFVGQLIRHGYDIYVVSGSNVWTVRYMVTVELMKRINEKLGTQFVFPADHVIGASVLLRDKRTGRLVKDPWLVRENKRYQEQDPNELNQYELTNQVVFPLTGFAGKVANIIQYITGPNERPFLVAGDSSGDFAMLQSAQYRLWFARLEKKAYQEALSRLIVKPEQSTWLVQPVLTTRRPGLIQNRAELDKIVKQPGETLQAEPLLASLKIWSEMGLYRD